MSGIDDKAYIAFTLDNYLKNCGRSHALGGFLSSTAVGYDVYLSIADEPAEEGDDVAVKRFKITVEDL